MVKVENVEQMPSGAINKAIGFLQPIVNNFKNKIHDYLTASNTIRLHKYHQLTIEAIGSLVNAHKEDEQNVPLAAAVTMFMTEIMNVHHRLMVRVKEELGKVKRPS